VKAVKQLEGWMKKEGIDVQNPASYLFLTCGNWDIGTLVPKQCKKSQIEVPVFWSRFCNIKTVFNNVYKQNSSGMKVSICDAKSATLNTMPFVGTSLFFQQHAPTISQTSAVQGMLKYLRIPLKGTHHLGMDDTANLATVVTRMLADGAIFEATGNAASKQRKVP
jgi:3'-5' exoribonuclease 1